MASPKHISVKIYDDDEDKVLGVGSYGKVCKAKYGQLLCAAKLLHNTMLKSSDPGRFKLVQQFEQECQFLSMIRHPNIVQYLGTFTDPNSKRLALLMELMDESLTRFLERSTGPLPYHIQLKICHDVALALSYLHSNAIIHRDLSSNNVLLIGEGIRAKVTDFGMSKLMDMNFSMNSMTLCPGAQVYMPPEALTMPPHYSSKLDCFSHGVLTIQTITRNFPKPGSNPKQPAGQATVLFPETERRKKDLDLIGPNHPLLPIALHCIKDRDTERPSADEICERLAGLKLNEMYAKSVDQAGDKTMLERQLAQKERIYDAELNHKDQIIRRERANHLKEKSALQNELAQVGEQLKRERIEFQKELKSKDKIIEGKHQQEKRERTGVIPELSNMVSNNISIYCMCHENTIILVHA